MSVERYTKRRDDGQAVMDCQSCPESWMNKPNSDCSALYCRNRMKDRLAAYEDTGLEPEDILSATDTANVACALHELNQYKELGDLDRLRKLVEADRDGRCVVLPVKPGGTVRFARNPRAKHETVDAITIYPDGRMSFGFHEYGMKTEWVDRWCEDDADNYVPVKPAEAALKGEQHEKH